MRKRDSTLKKFKRNKSDDNFGAYRVLRNRVKQLIRNAKYQFSAKILDDKLPANRLWKNIKSLGLTQVSANPDLAHFDADQINAKFSEIPFKPNFMNKIDNISYIENKVIYHNFPQFKLKPVSLSLVKFAFRRIKSLAKDDISLNLIKPIIYYILPA
jgi:hypothetical protein